MVGPSPPVRKAASARGERILTARSEAGAPRRGKAPRWPISAGSANRGETPDPPDLPAQPVGISTAMTRRAAFPSRPAAAAALAPALALPAAAATVTPGKSMTFAFDLSGIAGAAPVGWGCSCAEPDRKTAKSGGRLASGAEVGLVLGTTSAGGEEIAALRFLKPFDFAISNVWTGLPGAPAIGAAGRPG
jgi:hypothetical protein